MAVIGRPCKLTPKVSADLCAALQAGATLRIAADFAGIGERTLFAWLASTKPEFMQLQQDVKAATARGDVGALAVIQKAAKGGNWQAAAWLLERRHPGEYGRRQALTVARAPEVDVQALSQAAERGVGMADAAVLFQRQLAVLEAERVAGQISGREYLATMDRLTAQATRLAELTARANPHGAGAPQVSLTLELGSPAIDDPAPLPDGVEPARRASAGGDLIDVS